MDKNLISLKQINSEELSGVVSKYSSGPLNSSGQFLQSQITTNSGAITVITGKLSNFDYTVNTTGNQSIDGTKVINSPQFPSGALFGRGVNEARLVSQGPSGIQVTLPASSGTLVNETGAATLYNKYVVDYAPVNLGDITGNAAINFGSGKFQKLTFSGSALNRSITPVPTSGSEGSFLNLRVTSNSVGGYARTLSLDTGIVIPSDSAITFPKAMFNDKAYMMKMYYNGTRWELLSFVGGY